MGEEAGLNFPTLGWTEDESSSDVQKGRAIRLAPHPKRVGLSAVIVSSGAPGESVGKKVKRFLFEV
jgi:hypothetical protein